jgi:MoaA/NifB/PqqE/SkfB family radical SAM enzyme
MQEGRCLMLNNLLRSVDRAIADSRVSSKVSRKIISNFAGRVLMSESDCTKNFTSKHGFEPPAFLTISPTKKCNLFCKGCYASSSSESAETLPFGVLNRIIREKTEIWGSYFTVISGGEPLLYRSEGKSLFDVLEENSDNYFMMYTNSTLITEKVAERMAELGNITPAISVEGFEKETDDRRGKGVYKKILRAMENLRKAGVPFGVSATATRYNSDMIVSDEFVDTYFNREGAIYGWIFQYMPIGRSYTTDLMLTPEQRLALFQREEKIIREHKLFMVDFWNGGPYAVGCISAGRPGGYFYIDWNGNIAPCAFFPYYLANVYDVYREGKTINDVLLSPYFSSIRAWQNEYGYTQPPEKVQNYIVPCIVRDHYQMAYSLVNEFDAKPLDVNAANAIEDSDYRKKMTDYGREVKSATQQYWEDTFMGPLQ